MIDRRKKYLIQGKNAYPHMGQVLKAHFKREKISLAAVARELNVARGAVGTYLTQGSLQLGILWKIGIATNHNFLGALAEKFPVDYLSEKDKRMKLLLQEQEEKIKLLEAELAVYRRIVGK